MALVEESDDLVAGLEAGDARADGLDGAGAVGAGDHAGLFGEWVFALGNDEIAVVEGGGVDWLCWLGCGGFDEFLVSVTYS